jgi:hypothetical protein
VVDGLSLVTGCNAAGIRRQGGGLATVNLNQHSCLSVIPLSSTGLILQSDQKPQTPPLP